MLVRKGQGRYKRPGRQQPNFAKPTDGYFFKPAFGSCGIITSPKTICTAHHTLKETDANSWLLLRVTDRLRGLLQHKSQEDIVEKSLSLKCLLEPCWEMSLQELQV